MYGLKDQLARIEQEFGKDHRLAQMVRDQIAAKGISAQQLYITGSVSKQSHDARRMTRSRVGSDKK